MVNSYCDYCFKGFREYRDMRIHVESVHLKIKHRCPLCPQTFALRRTVLGEFKNLSMIYDMAHGLDVFAEGLKKLYGVFFKRLKIVIGLRFG